MWVFTRWKFGSHTAGPGITALYQRKAKAVWGPALRNPPLPGWALLREWPMSYHIWHCSYDVSKCRKSSMFGTTWRRGFGKLGESDLYSALHQDIREEHWFVVCCKLKCGSCPDHILGCWKTATPVTTSITCLDWVWPVKSRRSGRVCNDPWVTFARRNKRHMAGDQWIVGIMLHQLYIIPAHLLASEKIF